MKFKTISWGTLFLLLPFSVKAHCPLCTIGVAAAAGGAAYLGVHVAVIGLFVGAFAVSTGWWASRWLKKQCVPFQKTLIIVAAFLLTVIPILPLIESSYPLYIPWLGVYGTTLVVNSALVTSLLGGLVVAGAPSLSKKISGLREGKMIPFQGVLLTLALLAVVGVLIQVVM